jgi:hypothetical protein
VSLVLLMVAIGLLWRTLAIQHGAAQPIAKPE